MRRMLIKATGVWLIMMIAAILNGALREKVLNPLLGQDWALPLSGIVLSLMVFLIAWLMTPLIGATRTQGYIVTGCLWVALTLAFEYLFGHFIAGRPWHEINRVFKLVDGNLFVLVILALGMSPWMVAKLRRLKPFEDDTTSI